MSLTRLAIYGLCILVTGTALADGLTPQEARDRMVVPPGFRVEVFASEPEIRQPVAACFDERGRMWVIEYLQYPNPAGLVPVKVDQYLRTEYDRVPKPPPRGPRGADRIKILEDTDGDGKADKVTTFVEGLNLASGIAVGHGGVFIGQAPYLLFYPDKDRDDKPDGDPQVLLSGFGLQDAHATVNSLTWGPDGWLYGAQGSTVTAKILGHEFQQGIWRYQPITHKFELFAEGGGNTWGLDFDRGGNAFGSSNGSFIAFHMVQGGNYWKGFAKHGPLHNPKSYGYFDSIAFSGTKPGGHVTPGGIIYKGEQFPAEYRGTFLGANLLSNSVYWYKLAPKGSTFAMTAGGTLLESRDPWFRPIDLLSGPDGSVYVVDWYDKRASHLDPRDTWDRSNGRIYKISHGVPPKVPAFDLAKLSTPELIALRNEPNDWWSETARRILYKRRDFRESEGLLKLVQANQRDEDVALRDLFALNACSGLDEDALIQLLGHPLPAVRRWTVRFYGDQVHELPRGSIQLKRLAGFEPDPTVRSQLASSCGRWPESFALDLLSRMLARPNPKDASDPHLPLLLWLGIERVLRAGPRAVVEQLTASEIVAGNSEILRREILPRTIRSLSEDATNADLALCARMLDASKKEDRESLLSSMDRGLEGARPSDVPESLRSTLERIRGESAESLSLLRISVRLGFAGAYDRAVARLAGSKDGAERVALIELLGSVPKPEGLAALLDLIRGLKDEPALTATLSAAGRYPDPEIGEEIVKRYPSWSGAVRIRAVDILSSRKAWAGHLVDAIASKSIASTDLTIAQARRIAGFGDADLAAKLESVWGRMPYGTVAAKTRRMAEIRGILPEGDKGVAARGQAVFRNSCMPCHRLFGEGERIGPELTGAERGDLDFLLTSLVDPSAVVRKEYQGQTIALKDGRVLSGMVVEEDGRTLTLFDGQKQRTTLAKAEIEDRKASEASIMPEGLLDPLSDDQIRDLLRYLQGSGK